MQAAAEATIKGDDARRKCEIWRERWSSDPLMRAALMMSGVGWVRVLVTNLRSEQESRE